MKTAKEISESNIPRQLKIIRLWAMAMLNYSQDEGDSALDRLRELTDPDVTAAIMYLTGFTSSGSGYPDTRQLEELAGIGK